MLPYVIKTLVQLCGDDGTATRQIVSYLIKSV